ncbi:serine/threonine-protein kinase [Nocardia sp. NPDC058058]|uniref:serine/threonine-protein kinase n=1 Tax=Nocardia sp. NPDC058058 TaxID=3346317 RepID=UPI0036DE87DD
MDLRAGTNFSGFTICRLLGRGGMGAVYLAGHPRLDRQVALKVLNEVLAADPKARNSFEREARLATRLEHPNIVGVYDRSHPGDEELWLSMRFVEGGDVNALLSAQPQGLEVARAARLITDAAHALDYAHSHGVLHRDVKPANLLIDHDVRSGERAVLTDFGIARTLDDTATLTSVSATLAYAAPERFSRMPADHRADIYSLGATLYQLLTGQPPFPRKDQAAVIAAHLLEEAPSPRELRPELPAGLDAVLAAALAKRPEDRYQSCGALADAVERVLGTTGPGAESVAPVRESAPTPRYTPPPVTGPTTITTLDPVDAPDDLPLDLHEAPRGSASGSSSTPLIPAASPAPPPVALPWESTPAAPQRDSARRTRRVAIAVVVVSVIAASTLIAVKTLSGHGGSANNSSATAGAAPGVALTLQPKAIAVDPGTHAVYVTTSDNSARLAVLDPVSGAMTATIALPADRSKVAVDPVSHMVFTAGTDGADPVVDIIDPVAKAVTATIKVGPPKAGRMADYPSGLLVDPGTHAVYAFNTLDAWLSVVDPNTRTITNTLKGSFEYAVDAVNHRLAGVNIASYTAFTIDPATGAAADQTKVENCCSGSTVFDPVNRILYGDDTYNSKIVVIDMANHRVTTRIDTPTQGLGSGTLAIDLDTRALYVPNGQARSVSVIDLSRNIITATIPVADTPDALTLDTSTRTVYVISEAAKTLRILHL